MNLECRAPLAAVLLALPLLGVAAPVVRTLELRLSIDGTQDWRNDPQWGKSSTQQRYVLSTQLKSDGRLYVDNLLDPDPMRRMQIKSDWYLYQGLSELKAENGGRLPPPGQGQIVLSPESLAASGGMISAQMADFSPQRVSALQAINTRTSEDLEAFMRRYEQPGGRWMVFEGFAGCSNRLELKLKSRFEGDIAKKQGNKAPFDMQWDADTRGTPEQQASLCRRYVITYAPTTDTLIVENASLPAPVGTSVRHEFGRTENKQMELPAPYQVLRWLDDSLKQSRSSGKLETTLPLTAALDGKDAALGSFTGSAKLSLEWSFR